MIHSSLEWVRQELPLKVTWRAFELMPREAPPPDEGWLEAKRRQIEATWPRVQQVAREHYGLELRRGPWGVDTRLAHIGAKAARESGAEDAYHPAVFAAYWVEQRDIGERSVLVEVARRIGLDPDAFARRLDADELRAQVLADEAEAARLGIGGAGPHRKPALPDPGRAAEGETAGAVAPLPGDGGRGRGQEPGRRHGSFRSNRDIARRVTDEASRARSPRALKAGHRGRS